MRKWLWAMLLALSPLSVFAQANSGVAEIVVTASRRSAENYDERVPAVGLRRIADFAVQQVTVTCDTRDPEKRHDEIFATIRIAIQLASRQSVVELATGEMIVEPLTLANYNSLTLKRDDRPDTDKTSFLVKTRLAAVGDAKAVIELIDKFIKDVPPVGRAELVATDDLTLSVVGPDQYRGKIIDLVATDALTTAAKLGPDYGVEARGLDRPVEWSRASLTEVFLYVPYQYTVVLKPR